MTTRVGHVKLLGRRKRADKFWGQPGSPVLGITCRNRDPQDTFFPYCLLITLTKSSSHVIVLPESVILLTKLAAFSKPQRLNLKELEAMDADLTLD